MRAPAPSPESLSAEQAPLCVILRHQIMSRLCHIVTIIHLLLSSRALTRTSWVFLPSMWTINPTPQASFSSEGSYRPGREWGKCLWICWIMYLQQRVGSSQIHHRAFSLLLCVCLVYCWLKISLYLKLVSENSNSDTGSWINLRVFQDLKTTYYTNRVLLILKNSYGLHICNCWWWVNWKHTPLLILEGSRIKWF